MNDDYQRIIEDCTDELNEIEKWVREEPMDSKNRYLIPYAVVRASGTIEAVFKSLIYDFLSENCKAETQTFLEKETVDSSCNPKIGNIEEMLQRFDPQRKEAFAKETKGTQEKQDLNSLVALRNDIAHGRNINSSISIVQRYYAAGIAIIQKLDKILKKTNTDT